MALSVATALLLPLAATESGGEESSTFLVSPNVGLMVWTLIAFFVAFLVLRKLAFPRITEVLDKRQRAIEESIDSANRSKAEAEEVLTEYRERLKEARAQADDIVTRARATGQQTEKEAQEAGKAKREELLAQAQKDIAAEQHRALGDLRSEVASLTVQATEKVTRKTLTEEDQRRLVEEALGELDFTSLSGERR